MSAIPQALEELDRLLEAAERNHCQSLVLLRQNQIEILKNCEAIGTQNEYFARPEALK